MVDSSITIRRASECRPRTRSSLSGRQRSGGNQTSPIRSCFVGNTSTTRFGASPIWLAEIDGQIAGYRAFMRWELVDASGRLWRAVRAVDTATHPDFQRRGIFSRLTMHAVEEMRDEGGDIVFNTPNTQSRPGYLKMGWIDVGRLPVAIRPTSVSSTLAAGGSSNAGREVVRSVNDRGRCARGAGGPGAHGLGCEPAGAVRSRHGVVAGVPAMALSA